MSRRSVPTGDHHRWIFNRLAADYARRPGYPESLVARLLALAGGPGSRVADLGAGTGLLALPLNRVGLHVWAVEPAWQMLRVLGAAAEEEGVQAATGSPTPTLTATPTATPTATLTLVHAAGEDTGLPSGIFDLVVLADALHWMDAERAGREAARLLRPGGAVAVVVPRLAATAFLDALSARLAAANPKARSGAPPVALFLSHAGAAPLPPEPFVHEVLLSPGDLDAVLRSLSLVGPALGPAGVASLLAEARDLAATHGGAAWRRDIVLHAGRRPDTADRAQPGPSDSSL